MTLRKPEEYQKFLTLTATHSAREMSEILNVSAKTIQRWRKSSGTQRTPGPAKSNRWSQSTYNAVKRMVDERASVQDIANTLGVDRKAVKRHFPDAPWTLDERLAYLKMTRKLSQAVK